MSEKTAKTTKMDPELRTLGQLARILDALDPAARRRVVAWLQDRYGATEAPERPKEAKAVGC